MADKEIDAGQANPDTSEQGTETLTPTEEATKAGIKEEVSKDKKEGKEKVEDEIVPEAYDLSMPEGSLLQVADVEKLKAEAKEMGLTNSEAQEYLLTHNRAISSYHQEQLRQVEAIRADWVKEAEADTEIGGKDFKQNIELASRLLEKINPNIKPLLNASGFGNHPEVIRTIVRLVKLTGFSEDKFIQPKSQGSVKKSMEELFYGEQTAT